LKLSRKRFLANGVVQHSGEGCLSENGLPPVGPSLGLNYEQL
jgi:hypothetical protein